MTIKQQLIEDLQKVLVEKFDLPGLEPKVDYPLDPKHGDYSTNIAMASYRELAKFLKSHVPSDNNSGITWASRSGLYKNPLEVANAIKQRLEEKNPSYLERVDVVKPGFINFFIKNEFLAVRLQQEVEVPNIGEGKKVIVEYSSPNIAKPFTIGHLRSTIIGDAVANLLQATGWQVYRDNHVGDWGTQFGKQIYAIKAWGDEAEIEKSERPVKLLVDLYVKFHDEAEKDPTLEDQAREWFKKLEDGDQEAKALWQKCIDWSWKEFEKIYKELGVTFTENNGRGYGESFFEAKMTGVISELEDKGLLKVGENGARLVFFPEDKYPPLMILKKDGATLYATRDLATDKFRLEKYGKDVKIINEVGAEQALYFRQLYELERRLGWYQEGQRIHVKHGLYRFKEGKMSTRKGNVIWLEEVLGEAKKRATLITAVSGERKGGWVNPDDIGKIIQKDIDFSQGSRDLDISKIAIGALKWNDLKRSSEQDINFEWDEILNMQGNSGPYLQYTFARTQSVIARSEATKQSHAERLPRSQFTLSEVEGFAMTVEERELLRLLSRFSEVVEEAAKRLAPNILCTYLFELAQAFNLFYQKCPILKAEEETQAFRLQLTKTTGETVKKGLELLGIQAPAKM